MSGGREVFLFAKCSSNFFLLPVKDLDLAFFEVALFAVATTTSFAGGVEEYFVTNCKTLNFRLHPA